MMKMVLRKAAVALVSTILAVVLICGTLFAQDTSSRDSSDTGTCSEGHLGGNRIDYRAPTCTRDGYETFDRCIVCGEEYTVIRPATGHDFYVVQASVEPTCEKEGEGHVKCSVCGYEETNRVLPPLGHEYNTTVKVYWDEQNPARGHAVYSSVCSRCRHTSSEIIYFNADEDSGLKIIEQGSYIITSEIESEPTCTEKGRTTYTFIGIMDDSLTQFFENLDSAVLPVIKTMGNNRVVISSNTGTTPAQGHMWEEPVRENETPATCTAEGSYDLAVYCRNCGAEKENARISCKIAKAAHVLNVRIEYPSGEDAAADTGENSDENSGTGADSENVDDTGASSGGSSGISAGAEDVDDTGENSDENSGTGADAEGFDHAGGNTESTDAAGDENTENTENTDAVDTGSGTDELTGSSSSSESNEDADPVVQSVWELISAAMGETSENPDEADPNSAATGSEAGSDSAATGSEAGLDNAAGGNEAGSDNAATGSEADSEDSVISLGDLFGINPKDGIADVFRAIGRTEEAGDDTDASASTDRTGDAEENSDTSAAAGITGDTEDDTDASAFADRYDLVVYCSECGQVLHTERKQTEGAAARRPFRAVIENTAEASCEQNGFYEIVIYDADGAEIGRDGITVYAHHTPTERSVENIINTSCNKPGSYESVGYCSVCGQELGETEREHDRPYYIGEAYQDDGYYYWQYYYNPRYIAELPAGDGHGDLIVKTVTENGLDYYIQVCSICGETISRQQVVPNPAAAILMAPTDLEVPVKSTVVLETFLIPSDADSQELVWSSSNPRVAEVDNQGRVSVLKYGTADITAVSAEDPSVYAICTVHALFSDVSGSDIKGEPNYQYYYDPVYWAADNGIVQGYNQEYFAPQEECTRATMIMALWRMAGSPEPGQDARSIFTDMGEYDTSSSTNMAIAWAAGEGIIKGYDDNTIRPTDIIERKDAIVMLYRFAGKPKVNVSGNVRFSDISEYSESSDAYKSIVWAASKEIAKGYSDGTFGVTDHCLRSQIVTFLYRYAMEEY